MGVVLAKGVLGPPPKGEVHPLDHSSVSRTLPQTGFFAISGETRQKGKAS
jgi:hypothetical protein